MDDIKPTDTPQASNSDSSEKTESTNPSQPETNPATPASEPGLDGLSTPAPEPVTPQPTVTPPTPSTNTQSSPSMGSKGGSAKAVWAVIVVILLAMCGSGGFAVGRSTAPKPKPTPPVTHIDTLTVPQNATVIAKCAKNRGTQYALPKDIPLGPVYNVYNNKVIGVEYMVGKDDLLGGKSYLNLPLSGQTFDHVNIGLLSAGHAGYPIPHYHIDIMTVPTSVTDQIKC